MISLSVIPQRLFIALQLILIVFISFSAVRAAGEIDPTFNVNAFQEGSGSIVALAQQPDGKIIIVGNFLGVNGTARRAVARLNADGTVDQTFNPSEISGGLVQSLALQPDGKIIVGGRFAIGSQTTISALARLNANGSLDATFTPPSFAPGYSGGSIFSVNDIELAADGKIVIAGSFSFNAPNGTTRRMFARLNADGTPDLSFNPAGNFVEIFDIEIQPDGKIVGALVDNNFQNTYFLKRINPDGTADPTFDVLFQYGSVRTIKLLPDGKVLIGGDFSRVEDVPRENVARLNANGTLDATFNVTLDGYVNAIDVDANGRILVGGVFSTFNGVQRKNLARTDQSGYLDATLPDTLNITYEKVGRILPLTDGKVILLLNIDGNFGRAARLNTDGSRDTEFRVTVGTKSLVNSVRVQPDGKILFGGDFTNVNLQSRNGTARLNANGTLDTTFGENALYTYDYARTTYGIDLRPGDGKILISGAVGVRRLNPNGMLDRNYHSAATFESRFAADGGALVTNLSTLWKYTETGTAPTFTVQADSTIRKILPLTDGKTVIAGDFTHVGVRTRNRIARLNADGTLDTTFNPPDAADAPIYDLALQPDGKIIVGGIFDSFNGNAAYKYLVRLNADGTLDTSFNPTIQGGVLCVKLQSDGKILFGGGISQVNGAPRARIARVNADGTLDVSFDPGAGADDYVLSIDTQPDGNIIVGGRFKHFNNYERPGIARLLNAAPNKTPFDFDGDGKADLGVFRPSNGGWYIYNLANGTNQSYAFGFETDKITPADYDGDGRTDVAVFRAGTWYLNRSQLGFTGVGFGAASDTPVPADFDGDGKAELAVFRPSNGGWYIYNLATNQTSSFAFGQTGDKPIPADYDGDGKADIAVYRSGTWYVQRSQLGFSGIAFGEAMDKPVPADYDGDGKTDVAVFRPSTGGWYLLQSSAGFTAIGFGVGTDLPVPADYDGDGKADLGVFRDGTWYIQRTTQGFTGAAFGVATDKPVPNAFVQ